MSFRHATTCSRTWQSRTSFTGAAGPRSSPRRRPPPARSARSRRCRTRSILRAWAAWSARLLTSYRDAGGAGSGAGASGSAVAGSPSDGGASRRLFTSVHLIERTARRRGDSRTGIYVNQLPEKVGRILSFFETENETIVSRRNFLTSRGSGRSARIAESKRNRNGDEISFVHSGTVAPTGLHVQGRGCGCLQSRIAQSVVTEDRRYKKKARSKQTVCTHERTNLHENRDMER
jgi:hypothetical protein